MHNKKIQSKYEDIQPWAMSIIQNDNPDCIDHGLEEILDKLNLTDNCCRTKVFTIVRFDDELFKGTTN